MKRRFPIILFAALLATCTKEADIKLPEQEEKLVVTCFISPDDTLITAVVRSSSPKYNVASSYQGYDDIKDASVVLYSSESSAALPYVDSLNCYALHASAFPVREGRSYTLSVSALGRTSSAVTSVPSDTLPVRSLALSVRFSEDSTSYDASFSAEVGDLPGTTYVALFHRNEMLFPVDTMFPSPEPYFNPGTGQFEDDEKEPRPAYTLVNRMSSGESSEKMTYYGTILEFWALNCSREFYLYNRSAQQAVYSGGNPFGDPVLVYSNINNGFGCFGAYRVSKRLLIQ